MRVKIGKVTLRKTIIDFVMLNEQAVSKFKNHLKNLCFSPKNEGENRKNLIATQPGNEASGQRIFTSATLILFMSQILRSAQNDMH